MEKIEWLVFTCRACRRVIKLPPAMAGGSVVCPFCRTKVTVPKDAVIIEEAPSQNSIPVARSSDEMLPGVRGKGREEWEIGNKPIGGDLSFREKLHSTSLPELRPGAEGTEMHRANFRRRKLEEVHGDFDDPKAPVRKRRRRGRNQSQGEGAAFAKTFVRGLVIAVILMAGVAGWMGWKLYLQMNGERKPVKPVMVQESPPVPETGADGARKLETRTMAEFGPALKNAVLGFTSAKTVDDILPLVRDRARLEPKIRAYYGPDNPWHPIEIRNTLEADEESVVDGDFIVLTLILANYDEKPVSLERKGDSFLVDWESFTGYGDLSWEELKKSQPRQPVTMRVVIEKSPSTEYFNDAFPDPNTHHCYQLHDLKSEHLLSGYARKDSAVDASIRRNLKAAPSPAQGALRAIAVVKLRYPENSTGPQQVEITEFLENGWVFRPDN